MEFSTQASNGVSTGNAPVSQATSARKSTLIILWCAVGIVATMTILWELIPLRTAKARLDRFASATYAFANREIPLSPGEKSVFGKAEVFKRVYQVGGQRVVVQIIDGTNDRHAVHDPMHCFRGAGWERVRGVDIPVGGGAGRQITLKRGEQTAEAMYWFSNGESRHSSVLRCWSQTSLRRITFGNSGDEPLLIILQPLTGEKIDWAKLISDFAPLAEL